jgi:hypothetical protein
LGNSGLSFSAVIVESDLPLSTIRNARAQSPRYFLAGLDHGGRMQEADPEMRVLVQFEI